MRYYDYFRSGESEQFAFFRMPKILFTDPQFSRISTESKVLYGLMLDRMELSRRNGWVDEDDRVFIIFTVEEMTELMNRSESRIYKLLRELDTSETGIGLIERRHQGLGHPNLIYVKKFYEGCYPAQDYKNTSDEYRLSGRTGKTIAKARPGPVQKTGRDLRKKQVCTCVENRSASVQKTGQDLHEKQGNNTDKSNTDRNKTDVSVYSDSASGYGSFHNVRLMKQELEELKKIYPYDWENWIERLSKYMASTGRTYQNHFATICLWADKEKPKKKKRNYSYPEGASL